MDVRLITRPEVARLADVLAAAFTTDPLSRWLFGEDDLRRRLCVSFAKAMRVMYLPKGHSYTTGDLAGAALWAPPGKWKLPLRSQVRLAPTYLRLLGPRRMATRGAAAARVIDGAHPEEPHWHLSVLGVDPDRQRSGIGSALMRSMLDRADGEHALAYLETSRPDNVPYYEQFGFTVREEFDLPYDGPHLWTMSRGPQR